MAHLFDIDLISALLRGETITWPDATQLIERESFFKLCHLHGVTTLLYRQLEAGRNLDDCPNSILDTLRSKARLAAARELLQRRAVEQLLNELADRGVSPLLMKGTALAYSLYPAPELRARADTDLLLRKADREVAAKVFCALGYEQSSSIGGDWVSSQSSWLKTDEFAVTHNFDLHWRISNFPVFREKLTFDELWPSSVPIAALGPHARGLGAIHGLLFACMHRLGHRQAPYYVSDVAHRDGNRLIWLYDIFLLARTLDDCQWQTLATTARQKGLQEVCLDGLLAAAEAFGAVAPPSLLASLRSTKNRGDIPIARFSSSPWLWELWQIRQVKGWRQRANLIREHVFPSASYVLEKYRTHHRSLLPLLYLHRAAHGLLKRL